MIEWGSVGIWLKPLGNAAYVACLPLLCHGLLVRAWILEFSVDLFLTLSATLDRWVVKQPWDIPPPPYICDYRQYVHCNTIHTYAIHTHSQKCWDPWRQVSWANSCSQTRQLHRQTRVLQTSRLCHWSKDWGLQAQVYHHRCRWVCAKVYGGPCWRVPSRNTELFEEKAWQTATWTYHGSRQGMIELTVIAT